MSIAPFSFREFGVSDVEFISAAVNRPKPFLPTGRKQEEAAPPPPPPPPTYNEDQLRAAERDSYQKGFLSGVSEGKAQAEHTQAEIDRNLTQIVENFSAHYAPLFAIYREMLTHQAKILPQMAHAIAQKVAGKALSENAYAVVEDIATRCVSTLLHEPKLEITVHESLAKTLETKLQSAASSLKITGEIQVNGDATINPTNCRIEWKNGSMVRDTETLWQQVEQVITSMVASSAREVESACDALQNQHLSQQGE